MLEVGESRYLQMLLVQIVCALPFLLRLQRRSLFILTHFGAVKGRIPLDVNFVRGAPPSSMPISLAAGKSSWSARTAGGDGGLAAAAAAATTTTTTTTTTTITTGSNSVEALENEEGNKVYARKMRKRTKDESHQRPWKLRFVERLASAGTSVAFAPENVEVEDLEDQELEGMSDVLVHNIANQLLADIEDDSGSATVEDIIQLDDNGLNLVHYASMYNYGPLLLTLIKCLGTAARNNGECCRSALGETLDMPSSVQISEPSLQRWPY